LKKSEDFQNPKIDRNIYIYSFIYINGLLWTNITFFCDHSKTVIFHCDQFWTFENFRKQSRTVENFRKQSKKFEWRFVNLVKMTLFLKSCYLSDQINQRIDHYRLLLSVDWSSIGRSRWTFDDGRNRSSNDRKRKVCLSKVVYFYYNYNKKTFIVIHYYVNFTK